MRVLVTCILGISTLSSHAKVPVAVRDKTSYIGTLSSSRQNQSFAAQAIDGDVETR